MKKSKHNTKQQSFFKSQKKFFGGALLKGKRKSIRPLSSKDSIHLVLRSGWATGKDSFLATRNCKAVDRIIMHFAKKFGVKIYERSINGNHIHLLLKITNRFLYRAFIKAVSGKIASHVMGNQSFKVFRRSRQKSNEGSVWGDASKDEHKATEDECKAPEKSQSFWEFRPFSRIVSWGKDYKTCAAYLRQNILEALGFVPYKARKNYYSAWLKQNTPNCFSDLNIGGSS